MCGLPLLFRLTSYATSKNKLKKKGNVPIQLLIFFFLRRHFLKKLCDENWNEKSDDDFPAFFFVVMAPAFGSIAIGGSRQRWGWRLCKNPRERDNYRLE
jgi:hypothetical protein